MIKGYYFITDSRLSIAGNKSDVENAIKANVNIVQYRNKELNTLMLYKEALQLRNICKQALFIVNDRIDIALAVNADGVHLGQEDMPLLTARKLLGEDKIIGITVHNLLEAEEAQKNGADYLGVSPIFSTGTKTDAGNPCGTSMITKIKNECDLPVVAIGGITFENAKQVISSGADAICAISSVVTQPDVISCLLKFKDLFK